ncbi:type II toxin-antitoxin system VapC family toxin [Nocardia inohanensis]|uniref:type II toxin-antitoxin system VapC family toxin n=1 Tax=Nocardia inohanensis TaxID=209246 RepID=UPI0008320D33|nr:PIN domain-containing protein [Nocardia inohanensis]
MTKTGADHVIVDTNILLAASDTGRADFTAARRVLETWPAAGVTLYTSGQILREYLCVATRPADRNGLGLSRSDAIANTNVFGSRLRFLDETARVHHRLVELVNESPCAGKQVHDANIVATMLIHGVGTVLTLNIGDFKRFEEHIRIVGPYDRDS